MPKVFVNGISAKSGGGRSILTNFLKIARDAKDDFTFVVVVPDADSYREYANERVCLVPLAHWSITTLVPLASITVLPRLARRMGCDLIFNLADVPLGTRRPQVFLFDWAYAAFPESPALQLSTRRDRLVRRAKLFFFRWLLPYVDLVIAQNGVIADRLHRIYGCDAVQVVPNAVSLDNLDGGSDHDFALGSGYKLLCLSRYYSHKNIEVFLPVAERIRAAGEDVKIVTTISPDDGEGARQFLADVEKFGFTDIIVNLGSVPMKHVPSLYRQTDGLLLPTLLESFSGTYIEAMFHRRPVLTSRLPFAEAVCQNSAFYFDPNDPVEILDRVRQTRDDVAERNRRVDLASVLLSRMPTWQDAYQAFSKAFITTLGNSK
ncbi:glycosyltransferase [Paracoccaceae bacterium Fryx2]|nr:glycosyltransferase [Paracoccaceae bacterium Fryx2]